VAFAGRFRDRIVHAHLKDHRGQAPDWTHRIPGQGEMDYAAVFAALADIDFAGSVAVECFTEMPFEEACDEGHAAMTAAAMRAGVTFDR
jgi:sugar phosphate isomerase/epimerase